MHKKRKTSGVHTSSHKPTKKCAMKMKEINKEEKNDVRIKTVIDRRKPFIRHTQRTGENDLNKLRVNDS